LSVQSCCVEVAQVTSLTDRPSLGHRMHKNADESTSAVEEAIDKLSHVDPSHWSSAVRPGART
jgi:hypothetical protein